MATNSETRIGFIGVGTLGRGLALALDASGYNVTAAASRRRDSAQWLADRVPGCLVMDSAQQVSDACDLVFVTVPDGAITDVASLVRWRGAQGVVHCCGAASVELLESAAASGASVGAMHPFQTFAGLNDPADAARRLTGVTFAVAATGVAGLLASRSGNRPWWPGHYGTKRYARPLPRQRSLELRTPYCPIERGNESLVATGNGRR